jgi:hypothetical protein
VNVFSTCSTSTPLHLVRLDPFGRIQPNTDFASLMDIPIPASLIRDISPPRLPKRRRLFEQPSPQSVRSRPASEPAHDVEPSLAAVEAGKAKVDDHLSYFRDRLSAASRLTANDVPRLGINAFAELYERNQHEHGAHFVIHQHNHPRAGVHYDLRVQFSAISSLSFAIPKGLPGNPNSKSLGRMAIETRVHNLWNHLIESASAQTGSLLIWDTGTYTVLPRNNNVKNPPSPQTTDDEGDDYLEPNNPFWGIKKDTRHENEKLIEAFQQRHIRLRLHGTRLPENYTVTLRLPPANDIQKYRTSARARHYPRRSSQRHMQQTTDHTSDSEEETETEPHITAQTTKQKNAETEDIDTDSEEDAETRRTNAYPGSTNSIGSVHQRNWFLLLDRRSSGFRQKQSGGPWERDGGNGFDTFYVRGREYERSVVTGRLAAEVESDEGVHGYAGRAGWMGIMH